MADLKKLKSNYYLIISECDEKEGEFHFHLKGHAVPPFRIKIIENENNKYLPVMSHYVKHQNAGGPHTPSFHPQDSIDDALNEVFWHGFTNYDPDSEVMAWVPNEDY